MNDEPTIQPGDRVAHADGRTGTVLGSPFTGYVRVQWDPTVVPAEVVRRVARSPWPPPER